MKTQQTNRAMLTKAVRWHCTTVRRKVHAVALFCIQDSSAFLLVVCYY